MSSAIPEHPPSRSREATPGSLAQALSQALGSDRVLSRPVDRRTYSYDAYLDESLPEAVAFPRTAAEAAIAVKVAKAEHRPFVPRGRGTNLSGGTIPVGGGVVVELARMNRVLAIDIPNRTITVEAGVYNSEVSAAVDPWDYFYAPDPSSGKACSIGGNIAEGAGGPHCLKYGVTTNHVLGLEVVLPSGEIAHFGGSIPDLPGYDLVGLFVGSEGTLGICTQATLRIVPKPETVRTLLAVYATIDEASETVSAIIARGIVPATLEMMDSLVIQAVEDSLAAGFPRDAAAVLLIDLDGFSEGVEEQVRQVRETCEANGAVEVKTAQDEGEAELLWRGRKGAFAAISRLAPNYLVADGTVPRARLPEALRRVRGIAENRSLRVGNVFHAGDGNLHPLLPFDSRDPEETSRVLQAGMEILRACVELGGTVSGEHGIGTEKLDAMRLVFSEAEIEVQRTVRECIDRDGLSNPGKLLPARGHGPESLGASSRRQPAQQSADHDSGRGSGRGSAADEAHAVSVAEVTDVVREASGKGWALVPVGGGTRLQMGQPPAPSSLRVDVSRLNAVLLSDPASLVMRIGAGATIVAARETAAGVGLLLPLDAPEPERATIGGSIACNEQGPRRPLFGGVRDVVLGVGVVLASGEYVQFGGQTMKNVAGLDLTKLFIGSLGTIGVIVDATLRLLPRPPTEKYVAVPFSTLSEARCAIAALTASRHSPACAELLSASSSAQLMNADEIRPDSITLLAGYVGNEPSVRRQVSELEQVLEGGAAPVELFSSSESDRVRASEHPIGPAGAGLSLGHVQGHDFVDSIVSNRAAVRRGEYAAAAKALVPPACVGSYLELLESEAGTSGCELSFTAGLLTGVVQIAVRCEANVVRSILSGARRAAEDRGGSLVVLEGWKTIGPDFDGWGTPPEQVGLMRSLKRVLDPQATFNHGRYVGGI